MNSHWWQFLREKEIMSDKTLESWKEFLREGAGTTAPFAEGDDRELWSDEEDEAQNRKEKLMIAADKFARALHEFGIPPFYIRQVGESLRKYGPAVGASKMFYHTSGRYGEKK